MKEKRRKTDHMELDRISKNLMFLTIVTVIAILILASLLGYWQFYPYKVVETYPRPYQIVYPQDKIVSAGEYVTYEFKYNKYSDLEPQITRQFVDGLVFNIAGAQSPTIGEMGSGKAQTQIRIPETLPPGKYHIRINATYQVNPIRQIHYDSITETFEVVAKTSSVETKDSQEQ